MNQEDKIFLTLQRAARMGCIGPVDKKLVIKEKRSAELKKNIKQRAMDSQPLITKAVTEDEDTLSADSTRSEEDDDSEFVVPPKTSKTCHYIILSSVLSIG